MHDLTFPVINIFNFYSFLIRSQPSKLSITPPPTHPIPSTHTLTAINHGAFIVHGWYVGGSSGRDTSVSPTSRLSMLVNGVGPQGVMLHHIARVFSLTMMDLTAYSARQQVPSDMDEGQYFLPPANFKTQNHGNKIRQWMEVRGILLDKSYQGWRNT